MTAYKCRICNELGISLSEMEKHLLSEHQECLDVSDASKKLLEMGFKEKDVNDALCKGSGTLGEALEFLVKNDCEKEKRDSDGMTATEREKKIRELQSFQDKVKKSE